MTGRRLDLVFGVGMIAVAVLFLPRMFLQHTYVFGELLSDKVIVAIGSVVKLACLLVAAVFAGRAVPHFEPGNRARPAWRLMQLGFITYFSGQLCQSGLNLFATDPPYPSIADGLYMLGMLLLLASLATFAYAYHDVALAVRRTGTVVWAGFALLVLIILNVWLLTPVIQARPPLPETITNLAYPALDSFLLALGVVLLRATLGFRGSQLWKVWLTLLAGFLCLSVGDIAYAYFSTLQMPALDPVMDVMYVWSYAFLARGTLYQEELLAG